MTPDEGRAVQIAPGVHRIDSPLLGRIVSLYLFIGPDGVLLFDTGVAGTIPEWVLPALGAVDIDPERVTSVVVSHFDVDHFGGVGDVTSALPRARVFAHRADAPGMVDFDVFLAERGSGLGEPYGVRPSDAAVDWMRSVVNLGRIDETITRREFTLGDRTVTAIPTPGHSHGHLSLYDPVNSLLAIGDAVLGAFVPFADGTPAFPPTYRHEADYFATIEAIRGLDVETLATAHDGVLTGAAVAGFLTTSESFARMLREAVRDAVASNPRGIGLLDLSESLVHVGTWPRDGAADALAMPIAGHVEQMTLDGVAEVVPSESGAIIRPVPRFVDAGCAEA